jgi:hypothetical protein
MVAATSPRERANILKQASDWFLVPRVVRCSHVEASGDDAGQRRFNHKMVEAMNARTTPSKHPDLATPEVAVIGATPREQETASTPASGVLKELGLACWRGSGSRVARPSQSGREKKTDDRI